jgi:hypothetical protein
MGSKGIARRLRSLMARGKNGYKNGSRLHLVKKAL